MRLILNDATMTAVIGWWHVLHPAVDGSRPGDRAGRARLRRAETPFDALLEPQTHDLIGRVSAAFGGRWPARGTEEVDLHRRLAMLALALARIEPGSRSRESFAAALGRTPDGRYPGPNDRRRLSPIRFGALLRAADDADFARLLRRALAMLKGVPFDVPRFIRDLVAFDDTTRRDWTFQYHHTRRDAEQTEQAPDGADA